MAHLPPLGLGVYQLLEVQSSEAVLADYNIYMRNSRQEKPDRLFKIKEMQNSVDNIILENSYMKLWLSGMSGLLEVCSIIFLTCMVYFKNFCFYSWKPKCVNYFKHDSLSLENKYQRRW